MIHILLTVVAPIIMVAGLGALLDRVKILNARTISRIVIYLTNPALAFYGIANATITGSELSGMMIFFILTTGTITLIAFVVSGGLKLDRLTRSAFMLSMAMVNVGNYGIPLNNFAFGAAGMERAIIFSVFSSLTIGTFGIFLVSWGRASVWQSIIAVFKVPMPYAVALGVLVNMDYLPPLNFAMKVTELLGQASVPLMLIMLGVQISRTTLQGRWGLTVGVSLTRLIGGALVGIFYAALLGLTGITRQVAIIEAAMPTAVMASVLATEFKGDAKLVSSIVLLSTLLSLITLPILIFLLTA